MKHLHCVALVVVAVAACKGKVEYRDNPDTLAKLEACQKSLDEKAKYITDLEAHKAELELAAKGGEVVVTLKGPLPEEAILEIKGAGPSGQGAPREPRGNADDQKLYEAFIAAVNRSRGSIRKCYQNALKKDTGLQARTVTLAIAVKYKTSGQVSSATFSPRVSEHFNQCMAAIAQRWEVPAMPSAVTFQARQLLTPE